MKLHLRLDVSCKNKMSSRRFIVDASVRGVDGRLCVARISESGELGTVSDTDYIEAMLCFEKMEEFEWLDFRLQVGNDPDCRAVFDSDTAPEHSAKWAYIIKAKNEKPEKTGAYGRSGYGRVPRGVALFTSVMGNSTLSLQCRRRDRDSHGVLADGLEDCIPHDCQWVTLLQISVTVTINRFRSEVIRQTVTQLLDLGRHLIHSDIEGANQSLLDSSWGHGSASCSSPKIEFAEIKRLLGVVGPLFVAVAQRPVRSVVRETRLVPLSRVRRWDSRVRRRMQCGRLLEVAERWVPDMRPCSTVDIPAHRAFLSFLSKIQCRLQCMKEGLLNKKQQMSSEVGHLKKKNKSLFKWQIQDLEKQIYAHAETGDAIVQCQKRIRELLGQSFWRKVSSVYSPILMMTGDYFTYNPVYRKLYGELCNFERKHFWWYPMDDVGGLFLQYHFSDRSSYLQRKNSMLYEFWCYVKLIDAFRQNGFDVYKFEKEIWTRLKEAIVVDAENFSFPGARLESDRLNVRIIHGVNTDTDFGKPLDEREFCVPMKKMLGDEERRCGLLTPDFAIVISEKNDPTHWFWIVLDAKFKQQLSQDDKDKRWNKYPLITHRENGTEKHPKESWLIYAGNSRELPGVEGVFDTGGLLTDNVKSCTLKEGIVFDDNVDYATFNANLRVNASSLQLISSRTGKPVEDPFSQFANIQIQTAYRLFNL